MNYKRRTGSILLCLGWMLTVKAAAAAASPPPQPKPKQVVVQAKIVEYTHQKGVETGLSAYFRKWQTHTDWWGVVHRSFQGIRSADITFPTSRPATFSVFLDRIHISEGDIEMVLQALERQNKASILSKPRLMVPVGGPESSIETTQQEPYEELQITANTSVPVTRYDKTGVTLKVKVIDILDLDGNWATTEDTFIRMHVSAEVTDLGRLLVVNIDPLRGDQGIRAPELLTRKIDTQVWVRHGDVLMMGGQLTNVNSKMNTSPPWLSQAESMTTGLVERFVPGDFVGSPLSSTIGSHSTDDQRRELVFFIKAEVWKPVTTRKGEFTEFHQAKPGVLATPAELVNQLYERLRNLPQGVSGLGEEITNELTNIIQQESGTKKTVIDQELKVEDINKLESQQGTEDNIIPDPVKALEVLRKLPDIPKGVLDTGQPSEDELQSLPVEGLKAATPEQGKAETSSTKTGGKPPAEKKATTPAKKKQAPTSNISVAPAKQAQSSKAEKSSSAGGSGKLPNPFKALEIIKKLPNIPQDVLNTLQQSVEKSVAKSQQSQQDTVQKTTSPDQKKTGQATDTQAGGKP